MRNTANPEAVGSSNVLVVTIQNTGTKPLIGVASTPAIEGDAGTTTEALFVINLTAATGQTITGNYTTANSSAFGSASCSDAGADYESKSGAFSFTPGTTLITVPVKVCGDTYAEANETFRLVLSNISGANVPSTQGVGSIVNDDALVLVLEENGPTPTQAAALDAIFAVRDPFRVVGIPEWFLTGVDKNTRVALYARNLQLNPGELPSAVVVRVNNQINTLAESVNAVPNSDLTQVVFRLPNGLAAGTATVTVNAHTRVSNAGTIRIIN